MVYVKGFDEHLVRFEICKGIRKHISYLLVWNFMSFVGCHGNRIVAMRDFALVNIVKLSPWKVKIGRMVLKVIAMKKFVAMGNVAIKNVAMKKLCVYFWGLKNFKRMKWKLNVNFAWGGCCKNLYKCKISYVLLLSSFCLLITWFVIFLRYLEVFLDIFASSASLTSLWLGTEVWSIMRCCWSRCWHHLEIRLEINQEIPVWCVAL